MSATAGSRESTTNAVVQPPSVLFVDLDGTLVRTDLLHEALLQSVRLGLPAIFGLLRCLARGKAQLKRALAERVTLDAARLPIRQEVKDFLSEQRAQGVRLVLATASDYRWARQVADELGLFDDVLASAGTRNLKGRAKLEAIEAYCWEHGLAEFDYLGDSAADVPIWEKARRAYLVGSSRRLVRRVRRVREPAKVFSASPARLRSIAQALRPQQWVKNSLIFVPLALAHQFSSGPKILAAMLAFLAFSLCASGVYVVNDLLDLQADRHHPCKRRRPFASGMLPVAWGPPLAAACFALGMLTAALALPAALTGALLLYVVLTCLYSVWLKQAAMVDVLVLSGLYTLRILAGGLATGIPVSEWLMAFSMFLFLSLAFAKRYGELSRLIEENAATACGRGYQVGDWSLIESIGPTNGYLAVLVFALYVHSEKMKHLYSNGWALWLVCPLLIYWISRVWLKAKRGQLTEDPVTFAVKDRGSLLIGALVLALIIFASPQ